MPSSHAAVCSWPGEAVSAPHSMICQAKVVLLHPCAGSFLCLLSLTGFRLEIVQEGHVSLLCVTHRLSIVYYQSFPSATLLKSVRTVINTSKLLIHA